MKLFYIIIILLICNYFVEGQEMELTRCGNGAYLRSQIEKNPQIKTNHEAINNLINNEVKHNKTGKSDIIVFTIPVVFHILYNNPEQNISNAQIYSQLDVLNEDFRRINYDSYKTPDIFKPVGADCQIEFCLAKRDPNGNPTSGIIRKQTIVSEFSALEDDVKYSSKGGDNIWDRNNYLNIWVCNIGGGIAGYSSYPGWDSKIDGIVIYYRVFGRTGNHHPKYNRGRTLTHETGHWLSLNHLWGDDGDICSNGNCSCTDYCNDTPVQRAANYNCPTYPRYSCSADTSDMFMNYMDYTNDACMNIFTQDQRNRMFAVLNTIRASLKSSDGCIPLTSLPEIDFTSDQTEIPAGKSINFKSISNSSINKWLWIFDGGKPDTSNLKNPNNISYYKTGAFTVTLVATSNNGSESITKTNYIKVDTLGDAKDIKIKYNYFLNDSIKYYYGNNSLSIDFGKSAFFNVKIELFNVMGQQLALYTQNSVLVSGNQIISIPDVLTNHIYILRIQTHNGYFYKKIMVIK